MKYTLSINIEHSTFNPKSYIVTPNVLGVVGHIIDSFNIGIHSFNIIGSYGTGKSSFLLALEDSLVNDSHILLANNGQFNGYRRFKFYKIVGDYTSLYSLLTEHLFHDSASENLFENLSRFFARAEKRGEFVFIVIDEFGKLLEYAAKNNPERELYIFQKFTEFINNEKRNVILLTTLHQNFNSYARVLNEFQRHEWNKVKGRFQEIVFNEPVEQLLYLAAKRIERISRPILNNDFRAIYDLAQNTKFASPSIKYEDTAELLYPLDLFAAQALTLSIQRYGQNERTLFSFLESTGEGSLQSFKDSEHTTYNLADVYDYDIYNFHSFLSEINSDSAAWTGIRVAIERVEGLFEAEVANDAIKIVKTIGMINLFGNAGISCTKNDLSLYAKNALGIMSPDSVIDLLAQYKIIRYAEYKSQYVLFEGTDVNIESELLKASGIVPRLKDVVDKLNENFSLPVEFANAAYYHKGTPRYFEYIISDYPINKQPQNEVDGYINLVFNESLTLEELKQKTSNVKEAILYAYFRQTDKVIDHIWMLDKLAYVNNIIDSADNVAHRELKALMNYERSSLNASVLDALFRYTQDVVWVYQGNEVTINSKASFNKFLSRICDEVYFSTPKFINEMVNKHKPSSAMSLARVNYLSHLLENSTEFNLGFDDKMFKPEKTIYLTLLKNTGIHRKFLGTYELDAPQEESFNDLWNISEAFMESSKEKPRKLSELINALKARPFKLKQGVIDLWIPTYLIIRKNDYSLYNDMGVFIPFINRDVLDLMQKSPGGFQIKAFDVEGVKLDLYNKYREALNLSQDCEFTTTNLIETIRPFLVFYKKLNKYTKQTKRLKKTTLQFRNVLSVAKDPEKTFFEDLPRALGFKDSVLASNDEVLKRYVYLLQNAIRELRSCYVNLIGRIENALVNSLCLKSTDFIQYKKELVERYSCLKAYLLTDKQKTILNRILSPTTDKVSWYQSLAYVIIDKQLENLLDEEEEYLIDNLIHLFKELDKYIDISNKNLEQKDNFIRFEMISNDGAISPQVVRIHNDKIDVAQKIERQIDNLLSGDSEVDAYALLMILKKKLGDE